MKPLLVNETEFFRWKFWIQRFESENRGWIGILYNNICNPRTKVLNFDMFFSRFSRYSQFYSSRVVLCLTVRQKERIFNFSLRLCTLVAISFLTYVQKKFSKIWKMEKILKWDLDFKNPSYGSQQKFNVTIEIRG